MTVKPWEVPDEFVGADRALVVCRLRAWTSVGRQLNAELIGGGMYELEPGNKLWSYHTHHASEEWLLVVQGQPTLRSPDGEHNLREGDVVCFRRGKGGFHQVITARTSR